MSFYILLNGSAFQPGLIRRRKYDAPACFEVRIAARECAMFFEKLKNRLPASGPGKLSFAAVSLVLLLHNAGCGMRKVERQRQVQELNESSAHHADSLKLEKTASYRTYQRRGTDSISSAFALEIWPSGPFRINAEKGFEGTAERVLVHGHRLALLRSTEQSELQDSKSSLASSRKQDKQQRSLSQKQEVLKKNPAWKWALIMLALAIGCYMAVDLLRRHTFSGKHLL
ncbi:hypothetical protein ACTHQF_13255 [Pedobacter sp. SAFR-022]|uniref:hypothetical protein n=1 Tax=Pedobacter sp. SAFR-022 TaxID=3436861 RepID=UPI003F80B59D